MSVSTSIAAYNKVKPRVGSMRWRIINELTSNQLTTDELEVILNMRHQTCSARVSELAKWHMIKDTGKRRPTRSGCDAIVWELVT